MAIHALWEDRYGLSIRKGPLDLTSFTTQAGASHDNEGTVNTAHTTTMAHFNATVDPTSAQAAGLILGQRTVVAAGSAPLVIFGMPVVGNPDFSSGQETIEVQKTDGFATQRIGAANEAGDIFRAGQSPTTSFDYVVTGRSLVSGASLFFQAGCKETFDDPAYNHKQITLPNASDGSDPLYYGTFVRKMSESSKDSRGLSDGVGTSFALRASQTEPLQASLGMSGRILLGNQQVSTYGSSAFTLDGKKHFLLQDAIISIYNGTNDIALACSSFDINCSAEVSANRYNTFFPLNLVMGNYTVEGSMTLPAMGKGSTTLDHKWFMNQLSDAGTADGTIDPTQSAYFTPRAIKIGWVAGQTGSPGGTASHGSVDAAEDLLITLNAVITDVSMGGDVEADMTVSFRCMNQFTAGTDTIAVDAFKMEYYDSIASSWGYNVVS